MVTLNLVLTRTHAYRAVEAASTIKYVLAEISHEFVTADHEFVVEVEGPSQAVRAVSQVPNV